MISAEEFIKNLEPIQRQKTIRPLTIEEQQTKVEIIQYLLNNKQEVNYTQRIFDKLERVLNVLLGGN